MPYKDRGAQLQYWKDRYRTDHENQLTQAKRNYQSKRLEISRKRKSRYKNPEVAESNRKKCRQRNRRLKVEVIAAYGGKCSCDGCGESRIEFLTNDHIGGGGRKHYAEIGGPAAFYPWLKTNHFPSGFRVLLLLLLFCCCCCCCFPVLGIDAPQSELWNSRTTRPLPQSRWRSMGLSGPTVSTLNIRFGHMCSTEE
jgi:hypothetical protein